MRSFFVLILTMAPVLAVDPPARSTGSRTTPPTINSVMPRGIPIGKTSEINVDGLNLTDASAIYFSRSGITATVRSIRQLPDLPDIRLGSAGLPSTIDLGPLPPRMQVTFEVSIDSNVAAGPVTFRVQTPLGTTPEGKIALEPPVEVVEDREPNDAYSSAIAIKSGSILAGTIRMAGDVDLYKLTVVSAGQELSFENTGPLTGSTLQPAIAILSEDGTVEGEYGAETGFRHKFSRTGTFYVRVADFLQSGRNTHFYRLRVSPDVLITSKPTIKWAADHSTGDPRVQSVRTNTSSAAAQMLKIPAAAEGVIDAPGRAHFYKFRAGKGQPLVLDVYARRGGASALDSVLDIYDANGKPVEIAVARAIVETNLVLRDHPSDSVNFRLSSSANMNVGDWLLMGGEIMRLGEMNEGPDDDVLVEGFAGQRYSFFGTSGEAHHLDRPVHKVQIHPAGASFSPNGLPLVRLYARNDDGGPMYGRDSYLSFTPPADGEYTVRLRDSAAGGGANFSYRLNLRAPRPDFQLSVTPRNPNIPAGGTIPVTVTAFRTDGFDEPIDVALENLPKGITALPARIAPGQSAATVLLSARADMAIGKAGTLSVAGTAAGTKRYADADDELKLISVAKPPDLVMNTDTRVVEVEPGTTGEVTVTIRRQNNFGGRVPVEVRNLPPRVKVSDVGLNGVMINENEDRRTFKIEALDVALPIEQTIYVGGKVETRSESPVYAAPQSILLRVKPSGQVNRAAARP